MRLEAIEVEELGSKIVGSSDRHGQLVVVKQMLVPTAKRPKFTCERSNANWLCYSSEGRGDQQEDQEGEEGLDVMAGNPNGHVITW